MVDLSIAMLVYQRVIVKIEELAGFPVFLLPTKKFWVFYQRPNTKTDEENSMELPIVLVNGGDGERVPISHCLKGKSIQDGAPSR